ncbi:hypothetical protein AM500_18370 [Bacillus sp. FJAT-18017]|uniref:4'-phosphopantetheinyl transferase family protein n=1 Tax=Bacillus sp. FJAT-18017 TaxID=1705566 RepID=UPI0006AE7283|nr:4'-phosphopantetheinyl transferase superfamily protein [Bacillus sp. FJAT-18017]ALC91529.1 hypothetical protein AM500_18370 [Bacillus sp. FJAT-18017]
MNDISQLQFKDLGIICYACKATEEKIKWLTTEESVSWQSMKHRRKRMEWLSSRVAAKAAAVNWLEKYYELPLRPELITIFNTKYGIPYVKWPLQISTPNLSMSHTDNIGVATVSCNYIVHGCDIEKIKDRHSAFSNYFLTSDESVLWFNNNIKIHYGFVERKTIETMLWSAKESIIKAIISKDTSKKFINMFHITLNPSTKNDKNLYDFIFSYENHKGKGKWIIINEYVISVSILNSNQK